MNKKYLYISSILIIIISLLTGCNKVIESHNRSVREYLATQPIYRFRIDLVSENGVRYDSWITEARSAPHPSHVDFSKNIKIHTREKSVLISHTHAIVVTNLGQVINDK